MRKKAYSTLKQYNTFDERFDYLKLSGNVGEDTFGYDRYLNQRFYRSKEWKRIRDEVIARDEGCDLGIKGMEITGKIYIHHMNPIDRDDVINSTDLLMNPEYLICTSSDTHNAIHYGKKDERPKKEFNERKMNDTKLW